MLLIFPPVAKPCEPPSGIAKLAAALTAHGINCMVLDANLEGLLALLQQPHAASDTWTRRAIKNVSSNLAALRDPRTYQSHDRYIRAVRDVNRVLEASGKEYNTVIGLADYRHQQLSPVRSADLIFAAKHPEISPFFAYFSKRLREIAAKECTGMVGFSLNYLSQALCTFAMIGYVKQEYPDCKIVLGGGLVSSWVKRPGWKDPFGDLVDHLIAGPGEGPLLALFGIRQKAEIFMPEYESLRHNDYLSPGFILPYSGSSGCYWNKCSFCPETAEDNPYIPVPAEQAMTGLRALVKRTEPTLLHLLDNSISPALLRALAHEPLGVAWYGFARISAELTNLEYCMALKRSGCKMLKLGLESGDQTVLDRMQKGTDLTTASVVLKNLKKAGIAAYVYLLFGTPAETLAEAKKTLAFVADHHDAITFLNLAIFNMPVCSQESAGLKTEQFYEGDLSLYTAFKHPKGWDRRLVRQFLDNEFKKQPAVAAILKNDPPIFTSNHAAFFCSRGHVYGKQS